MKKISVLIFSFLLNCLSIQAQLIWTQMGKDIDGEATSDLSGYSVSLNADGSVVAIGAIWNDGNGEDSGHVRVYNNQEGIWTQIGEDIDGEATNDLSGYSVSLSADGSIVAIGAIWNNHYAGSVRIYQNQGGNWEQIGEDIDGNDSYDTFGWSVSLSEDGSVVAIVGNHHDMYGNIAGYVNVYKNQGGTWIQIDTDITSEVAGNEFVNSVSLSADGSIVALGGVCRDEYNSTRSCFARVYKNQEGEWMQIGVDIDNEVNVDEGSDCAVSLSADGSVLAIRNSGSNNSVGHVWVYKTQDGVWTQVGNNIDGEIAGDWFGASVSLSADGSVVAIGSLFDSNNDNYVGYVRVYKTEEGNWIPIGEDIPGKAINDHFGYSVSLSANGSVVAIGAPQNDENGEGGGYVKIYTNSSEGIEDLPKQGIVVYPNPSKDIVRLTFSNNQVSKLIFTDIAGKEVFVKTNIQNTETIDLSDFSNGMYIIKAITTGNKVFTTQVVKD